MTRTRHELADDEADELAGEEAGDGGVLNTRDCSPLVAVVADDDAGGTAVAVAADDLTNMAFELLVAIFVFTLVFFFSC